MALRNGRLRPNTDGTVAAQPATDTPAASISPTPEGPTAVPPTPTSPLPPAVVEAQEKVRANPADPNAMLMLSLAFWDAGLPRQALESLNEAANLAGQDRPFLMKAALEYSSREAWVASAAMYVRAVRTYAPNERVPDDVTEGLHEAMYKAADNQDLPLYLPFDTVERLEQPMGLVARGRFALKHGDIADARFLLNQVKRLKPGFPEATLLESEIYIKEGRFAEARQLLTIMSADLGNPDWVRAEADKLLNEIPQ
jgi:thioredoxin-like negative regulator of GroEL